MQSISCIYNGINTSKISNRGDSAFAIGLIAPICCLFWPEGMKKVVKKRHKEKSMVQCDESMWSKLIKEHQVQIRCDELRRKSKLHCKDLMAKEIAWMLNSMAVLAAIK